MGVNEFVDMWKSFPWYIKLRQVHLDSLIEEGYVILFDDDVLLISDQLIHNKISLDRYSIRRYSNRLDTLEVHTNGRYIKASETFLTPQVK